MSAARIDHPALATRLSEGGAALGLSLSQAGIDRLVAYTALLAKWNKVYNLTAVRDPESMVTQHMLDSLAAVPAIAGARQLLDVGSGGGLPALVFAIWAQDNKHPLHVSMVDTVHKKTAFLTQAKAELGLDNVTVLTGRVEELPALQKYDCITSRAFASLGDFVNWSAHLLAEGGAFVAMKGVLPEDEIAALPAGWQVSAVQPLAVPGLDAQRHVLCIEKRHGAAG